MNQTTPTGDCERILGHVRGSGAGPTMIVLAGVHGNEPSGIAAARSVIAGLEKLRSAFRGEIWFLAGNLRALEVRSRFIHLDLNRQWTPEKVGALFGNGRRSYVAAEHHEQRELLEKVTEIVNATQGGPLYFLDLHTCSSDGPPFVTVGDTLRNRAFAMNFPLPLILGLEEQVDGALLEFLNNYGFITMGVESGRHDAVESVERHASVLWLAVVAAGLLDASSVPDIARHRSMLEAAGRSAPRVVEVRVRHAITDDDHFRMEPDFESFQPVRAGQVLAHDRNGPVTCPEDGLLLLPLYQGQGDDGFFIARQVKPFWLTISTVLRRLRLGYLVHLLPGVRRHAEVPGVLVVNTRVARWFSLEILHLLGYRKLRKAGAELVVSRRRYDLNPPRRISLGFGKVLH